ncbi:hypothetical protein ACSSV1_001642 [Labrenzia sp. MBR-25]|jgi:hypothetical protein
MCVNNSKHSRRRGGRTPVHGAVGGMPGTRLLPVECLVVEFNKYDAMEGHAG